MNSETARSYLLSRFTQSYNGVPSTSFDNAAEFNNFLSGLTRHGISHRTKIVKRKPRGRQFIVMKIEEAVDGD